MKLSFQKIFYAIATIFALFAILVLAKTILIPLSFALLLSFMLLPVAKKFEHWGLNRIIASSLSMFTVLLIVVGIIFIFSTQIIDLSIEFSQFQDKIIQAFADITLYINKNAGFIPDFEINELPNRIKEWLSDSTGFMVRESISSTTTFLTGLMATIIFTFLFLIYRSELTFASVSFFSEDNRERVFNMFKSIQQVGQKYFLGMGLLVLIIGLGNSFGLWVIGIESPFLFGFLGAGLSIIPYVGTVLGAIIPIIYAFVSYDSPFVALSVAVLFWAVQLISDNFLTPKIVGGSLKINALAAILSLIIGASVWGVVGMILFLPFAAMLKVICEEYEELKPVALLIGDQSNQEKEGSGQLISKWVKKIRGIFTK